MNPIVAKAMCSKIVQQNLNFEKLPGTCIVSELEIGFSKLSFISSIENICQLWFNNAKDIVQKANHDGQVQLVEFSDDTDRRHEDAEAQQRWS
jgi:hypothetical protein